MSPLPRPRSRYTPDDSNRPLRNRLDILIALVGVQFILVILLLLDRGSHRPAQPVQTPSKPVVTAPSVTRASPPSGETQRVIQEPSEERVPEDEAVPPVVQEQPKVEEPLPPVRVQVLNGCGEPGLARKMQVWLARRNFDVRDVGNADRRDYAQTLILDRAGRRRDAVELAKALDLSVERISTQPGSAGTNFDLTVIIGRDYARLPFVR